MHTLNNLKHADKVLAALQEIKKKGRHVGAGLSITIGVGANDKHPVQLEVGICTDLDKLMEALLAAADDSVKYWLKQTANDCKRASEYLDERAAK